MTFPENPQQPLSGNSPFPEDQDQFYMHRAIELARLAEKQGEVPVGALIVREGLILGEGHNQPILMHDPTAHAEIEALKAAGKKAENYRLIGATLYVTLEPCVMCMGALSHARIQRIVYGASDPKRGAAGSALQLQDAEFLNHRIDVVGGVLATDCSNLLVDFFRARR
jgi:tRNA(adenine34) deaminase